VIRPGHGWIERASTVSEGRALPETTGVKKPRQT
jgi:hypothetical protein